jgi:hypothetical protein
MSWFGNLETRWLERHLARKTAPMESGEQLSLLRQIEED